MEAGEERVIHSRQQELGAPQKKSSAEQLLLETEEQPDSVFGERLPMAFAEQQVRALAEQLMLEAEEQPASVFGELLPMVFGEHQVRKLAAQQVEELPGCWALQSAESRRSVFLQQAEAAVPLDAPRRASTLLWEATTRHLPPGAASRWMEALAAHFQRAVGLR